MKRFVVVKLLQQLINEYVVIFILAVFVTLCLVKIFTVNDRAVLEQSTG